MIFLLTSSIYVQFYNLDIFVNTNDDDIFTFIDVIQCDIMYLLYLIYLELIKPNKLREFNFMGKFDSTCIP